MTNHKRSRFWDHVYSGVIGHLIGVLFGAAATLAICLFALPIEKIVTVVTPGETVVVQASGGGPDDEQYSQGWVADPDAVKAIADTLEVKVFSETPAGQVEDLPKFVYGWKAYETLYARPPPIKNQGSVGSCVSFGTNTAIERTLAAEILARKGRRQEWTQFTEEATYGGSRVEIGGGRIRGDGSVGAWAAQFVTKYGMVPRQLYHEEDLSQYDEPRCRKWGNSGVPEWAEIIARKYPVKSFVQVKSWDDVKKACASGYFIAICSNQGFDSQRDANGVARAKGSWAHCMALDGYHTEGNKEYGHIVNSWGTSWITGPVGWGNPNPDGFWAESSVIDRMVRQGDSWAFSGTTGFEVRKLNWFIRAEPKRLEFDRSLALSF